MAKRFKYTNLILLFFSGTSCAQKVRLAPKVWQLLFYAPDSACQIFPVGAS